MLDRIVHYHVRKDSLEIHHNRNIMIILNLRDDLQIQVIDKEYKLKKNDIILLNSMDTMKITVTSHSLYVQFIIDYYLFKMLFHQKKYYFLCNSSIEQNDNYRILERYLAKMISKMYENNEYKNAEIRQIEYEFMIFLVDNFTVSSFKSSENQKLEDVIDYIDSFYSQDISLHEISEHFSMTPQYFSKYFKEKMNITFHKYKTQIKLEHATQDLLMSQKTLLHIALDNGFPNIDSFNKSFYELHEMKPSEYKKKYQYQNNNIEKQPEMIDDILNDILKKDQYLENKDHCFMIDCLKYEKYQEYWKEILNLGNILNMNDIDVQTQLSLLQKELSFRYLRIDIFYPEYYHYEDYSFYKEERIYDYLMKLDFTIWLKIDFRRIVNNEGFFAYFRKLLSHFANRYSIDNIKKWKFELIYNTTYNDNKSQQYFDVYTRIQNILGEYDSYYSLYGPCMMLGYPQYIENFIINMRKRNIDIQTMTFSAEPFVFIQTENGIEIQRTKDMNYIKNKMNELKNQCGTLLEHTHHICITNWNHSLSQNNILNDSCYRGAYIVKNMIECLGVVDALTYGKPLDLTTLSDFQGKDLLGAEGLVSKHGIKKPVYFAYYFLNHLGQYYIDKDEHSLITASGTGNYVILCHNYKRLNHKYYLEENNLDIHSFHEYFEDYDDLTLNYRLDHVKNGTYLIKIRTVNQQFGSVQDTMMNMLEDDTLTLSASELEFLKQVSIPSIQLLQRSVKGNSLELSVTLKANEFKHIHIIYLY
ncbi:helix-turn-helix domain-containing protein [Candidatus Stoquefichus massiliensis]|uniref:helix-turn-helix domain-containing protein n=1 Tax=Candidatus Stoquefichus massiliensis TaxID=1470350 RepID=UPI000484C2E9|nr:helix-turn-helix domain-containing protein [Candidatus Stoquefichus massiliensis]